MRPSPTDMNPVPSHNNRFIADWAKVVEAEAYIMKDVPGWKAGANVYNNGKWYPPCTSTMPGSAPYS